MKVLLSIKPEFVERIFSREKRYEYRKSIFKRTDIDTVVIYSTMPEGKIVGEFSFKQILNDSPDNVWKLTKQYSGVNKKFYDGYFDQRDNAYAIEIANVVKYDDPIALNQLARKIQPPQSFRYLTNECLTAMS